MPTVVTMPKWGLTMVSGTVTGWSQQEGDTVTEGSPLLTVETEKAVDDVEAPATGILRKIVAVTGAEVPVMGAVAVITAPGEELSEDDLTALLATSSGAKSASSAGGGEAAKPARESRQAARDSSGRISASPAARKRAGELGVDLATVQATGPNGRITSEDVERAAEAAVASAAAPKTENVTLIDGTSIAALVAGPTDSPETILFIHGLGGSLSSWAAVMGELAEHYRVAAIDLPGHGSSDKPSVNNADYSIAGLATTVGEVVEKLDLAPVVLVGHSLGGAVALQLALDRPKLVRAVAVVDGAGLGKEISTTLLDRIEAPPSRDEVRGLLELFFADKRFVLDRGIDEMLAARTLPGADAAAKAIAAKAFSRDGQLVRLDERLSEVTSPLLIVWGENDRVVPATQASAAAQAVPSAWVEVLEGIGHVPQVEASQAFTAVTKRWLAALPRA